MNALAAAVRRECRVAFSLRAQPAWLRIIKWIGIGAAVVRWHARPGFWGAAALLLAAALALHFFYRWKTRTWTCSWGGWNDLPAGRD